MELEVVLPRRSLRQPAPAIGEGGDCGPCCLGGLLNLGGVAETYDQLVEEDERKGMTWPGMRRALNTARSKGLIDRWVEDVPYWPPYPGHMMYGSPAWLTSTPWFRYVVMALDAGYYGLIGESADGAGPLHDNDHWVLLIGARATWQPGPHGSRSLCVEILTSCSVRGEQWYDVGHFLKHRGGFNALFARPT